LVIVVELQILGLGSRQPVEAQFVLTHHDKQILHVFVHGKFEAFA
jgi:hypothetical protein